MAILIIPSAIAADFNVCRCTNNAIIILKYASPVPVLPVKNIIIIITISAVFPTSSTADNYKKLFTNAEKCKTGTTIVGWPNRGLRDTKSRNFCLLYSLDIINSPNINTGCFVISRTFFKIYTVRLLSDNFRTFVHACVCIQTSCALTVAYSCPNGFCDFRISVLKDFFYFYYHSSLKCCR